MIQLPFLGVELFSPAQMFHVEHSLLRERSSLMSTKPKSAPRLGRGLSSLINVSELPVEAEIGSPAPITTPPSPHLAIAPSGPQEIPLGAIATNPHQPRREMNEPGIQAL